MLNLNSMEFELGLPELGLSIDSEDETYYDIMEFVQRSNLRRRTRVMINSKTKLVNKISTKLYDDLSSMILYNIKLLERIYSSRVFIRKDESAMIDTIVKTLEISKKTDFMLRKALNVIQHLNILNKEVFKCNSFSLQRNINKITTWYYNKKRKLDKSKLNVPELSEYERRLNDYDKTFYGELTIVMKEITEISYAIGLLFSEYLDMRFLESEPLKNLGKVADEKLEKIKDISNEIKKMCKSIVIENEVFINENLSSDEEEEDESEDEMDIDDDGEQHFTKQCEVCCYNFNENAFTKWKCRCEIIRDGVCSMCSEKLKCCLYCRGELVFM